MIRLRWRCIAEKEQNVERRELIKKLGDGKLLFPHPFFLASSKKPSQCSIFWLLCHRLRVCFILLVLVPELYPFFAFLYREQLEVGICIIDYGIHESTKKWRKILEIIKRKVFILFFCQVKWLESDKKWRRVYVFFQ